MFRIKIALLSVLISGSVLIIFGLIFLTVISKVGMNRIDREILTLGESQLHVWHPKEHWQDFDRSLRSIYGLWRWMDLIVQITDADHQRLYRSPHWPQEITIASFPEFDIKMAAGPGTGPAGGSPFDQPIDNAARTARDHNDTPVEDRQQHDRRPPRPVDDKHGRSPPPPRRPPASVRIKKPFFLTLETAASTWRTCIMGNQHITILIGMDMTRFYEEAKRYEKTFLFAVPLALMMMAGGGWLIAHRALKPVALITRTAEKITAHGLDQRIPATGADSELLRLVMVINDMLDRIEKSFGQAVRFSADAAHELQTPLTILQGVLDDAVQHTAPGTDEQRRYNSLLEEVQRLKNIVRKLLVLAQADAGQLLLRPGPTDISAMIASAVEDAGAMAPHLSIEQDILPGVMVQADPDLLKLVIQNLTTNAVKFNCDDGLIRFKLTVQNKNALFTISNTGPPISAAERDRIFDRFYRMDKSRSQSVPGIGLGLSLAREIVRAHKGKLRLDKAMDNLITFSLSLPSRS